MVDKGWSGRQIGGQGERREWEWATWWDGGQDEEAQRPSIQPQASEDPRAEGGVSLTKQGQASEGWKARRDVRVRGQERRAEPGYGRGHGQG